MGRSKQAEIDRLNQQIKINNELNNLRNEKMRQKGELFERSLERELLEEKLNLSECLNRLMQSNYDGLKQTMGRKVDEIVRCTLAEKYGQEKDGFIYDFDIRGLREQIQTLTGSLENREETIEILKAQIEGYQIKYAELRNWRRNHPVDDGEQALLERIDVLSAQVETLQSRYQASLDANIALLEIFKDGIPSLKRQREDVLQKRIDCAIHLMKDGECGALEDSHCDSSFGEKEKQELQLQIEALKEEITRLSGKKAGRPCEITNQDIERIHELRKQQYSIRQIAKAVGCSVGSVSRYLKRK